MLKKVDVKYSFNNKRNFSLITPCCAKNNKDGKFVNYKNYPSHFGYCHSCGQANMPPAIYIDKKGVRFIWDEQENGFIELTDNIYNAPIKIIVNENIKKKPPLRFINSAYIVQNYNANPNDNLTRFLYKNYDENLVLKAINKYQIKSAKDGGTVFLLINKDNQIQKIKISYYNEVGKRSNRYSVPFKNSEGYYDCLFGEHLLVNEKKINLVESEKTALVCSILFPNYNWLAYGGANGLTDLKLKRLEGKRVLIIPDISNSAVKIMNTKKQKFINFNIDASIWDMTEGKNDFQLKKENIFGLDLEDFLRNFRRL